MSELLGLWAALPTPAGLSFTRQGLSEDIKHHIAGPVDHRCAAANTRAGFACTRQELSEDIKQLYQTGLFESVNARVLPQKKGKFKVR